MNEFYKADEMNQVIDTFLQGRDNAEEEDLARNNKTPEDEEYIKPDFLGKEVTGDKRFYNSHLMRYPYVLWGKHFEQEEMNK